MSVLLRGSIRPKNRVKRRGKRPSIREVCLLGTTKAGWASGQQVTWSGRAYRVEATQDEPAGAGDVLRYVHLSSPGEG